jgi:hypothetical protein
MIDVFLIFLVWSLAPIALPIGTPRSVQGVLFYIWAAGQMALLVWACTYLARQTFRARRAEKCQVAMYVVLAVFGASAHVALQWDAQATYDRVARLTIEYRGLWSGLVHGGNSWILGYPPGTALTVVWAHLLHLPTSNIANVALLTLFFCNWTLRYVSSTGMWRSGFIFAALVFFVSGPIGWATPIWHYVVYYNNIVFALIWMLFIFVELRQLRWSPAEHLGYALALVWLRPVVSIAALPILSVAAMRILRCRDAKRACVLAAAALAVQCLGVVTWNAKEHGLERMQAAYERQVEQDVISHKDAQVLRIDIKTNPRPTKQERLAPVTAFERALSWAAVVTSNTCGGAMAVMAACSILAWATGWRQALVYAIPPLNLVALVFGTGFFAIHYPTYQDNYEAFQRLLIIGPILMAAVVVAIDAELAAHRKRLRLAAA